MLKSFVHEETGKKIRLDKNKEYSVEDLETEFGMTFKGDMPSFLTDSKKIKSKDDKSNNKKDE